MRLVWGVLAIICGLLALGGALSGAFVFVHGPVIGYIACVVLVGFGIYECIRYAGRVSKKRGAADSVEGAATHRDGEAEGAPVERAAFAAATDASGNTLFRLPASLGLIESARIPVFFENSRWRVIHSAIVLVSLFLAVAVLLVNLGIVGGSDLFSAFSSARNFGNIAQTFPPIALMSIGMAVLFSRGGIDLSIGSVVGLTSVVAASLTVSGTPGALWIAMGVALLVGVVNAVVVGVVKVPGALVTIAMAMIARYVATTIANGQTFLLSDDSGFASIGIVAWILLLVLGVAAFIWLQFPGLGLRTKPNTDVGASAGFRRACAIGAPYVLSSVLAGLSGLFLTAWVRSGMATLGTDYEVEVLLAVVLAGCFIGGRYSNLVGVLFGSLYIAAVRNAFNLENVGIFAQQIAIGSGVLFSAAYNYVVAAIMGVVYRRNRKPA